MNLKKIIGINGAINNVLKMPLPYWALNNEIIDFDTESERKMVIFFGNDLGGILGFGITSQESYTLRVNDCLGYIRKKFQNYDLCYRAHPGDDSEQHFLNLEGFRVLKDGVTAEIFLSQNLKKIKSVFTVGSFSSFNGYSMGLDSHVFYHCFADIYNKDFLGSLDCSFSEMPDSFFIRNLSQTLIDNSQTLKKDASLEAILNKILAENNGKIWMYCSFSEFIVALGVIAHLIRDISPGRQIGLIISHHSRWDRLKDYLHENFDELIFVPRIHYSLKPARLLHAVRLARQVKNFKILLGDILMVSSQPDFIENCLISYHKKNLRIGLTTERDFNAQYNLQSWTYTGNDNFHFNKATWFFNKILEPILGLYRSLFLSFTEMNRFYFNRYQRPINEVFDRLIIFETPKK